MADELTPLERQVIALSLDDPLSSLMRRSGMFLWLFGHRATSLPLANPRLEALRRYAILSRTLNDIPPQGECDRLRGMGYDSGQKDAIDRLIAPYRIQNSFHARVGSIFRRRAGNRAPGSPSPVHGPGVRTLHFHSPQHSEGKYA